LLRSRLKAKCANEKEQPPNDEANEWGFLVEHYLLQELDSSYVAIFRSTSGVPLTACSINSIPHRDLWAGIHTRLFQLEQILTRLEN
jgi:hypothetical protein